MLYAAWSVSLLEEVKVRTHLSFLLFFIPSLLFCPQKGRESMLCFYSPLAPAGSICPLTVYDRHGFKAMLHFSGEPAPGRPDVLVMVLSMLSTSAQPVKDIVFQAAVPKVRSL